MKVVRIYDLHRNDCTMDCKCERCEKIDKDTSAYNDVVPNRYCPSCGWSTLRGQVTTPINQ